MPSDNEIREAVERLNYYETIEKEMAGNDEAIKPLREVADLYLQAAKGMPEEEKVDFRSGTNYETAFANGFNVARSLCIAAVARKMDKDAIFIKHIHNHLRQGEEVICKICGKSAEEIIKEMTK